MRKMKRWMLVSCALLMTTAAALGGMISEDPGELIGAVQLWRPGEGDSDLFNFGYGAIVSYREWFRFPWGVGLNLGVAQWQVDSGSQTYKWQNLRGYDGDALLVSIGPALLFSLIDWDNWNFNLETGIQYVHVDSSVSVYSDAPGHEGRREVDIGGDILWHVGAEYEYMVAENLYLLAGAGYQKDLMPADTEYDLGKLRDTYLHGFFFRVGAKYLF